MAKIVVTGGAGFIGSHLTDSLLSEGNEVFVVDNLSTGLKENVSDGAVLMKRDIRHDLSLELADMDTVFHLAADPNVRESAIYPGNTFDTNVSGTFSLLESCRKADVKHVVLASTSTVYGETDVIPTPETHACTPISNYGASKLACEAFLSAYSKTYGMKGTVLRFANIFGERSTHGVMFDFYNKLKNNPREMEILGNGKQDKSYIHVSDSVSAVLMAWKGQKAQYDVYNVGSQEKRTVNELAEAMFKSLGLKPTIRYTGTPRGWVGDMKVMLLDTKKLEALGWKPKVGFEEGVGRYIRWLKERP
jgi:UDP-glucose 4-epimerase